MREIKDFTKSEIINKQMSYPTPTATRGAISAWFPRVAFKRKTVCLRKDKQEGPEGPGSLT